jgi:cytochrome c biogenesis protein CcdA
MKPPNYLLTKGRTERELYSGKVPLKPIHRIGFMILGFFFVVVACGVAIIVYVAMRKEGLLARALLFVLALGWFLLFFTLGRRMIWAALTAPSDADEEEDHEDFG